MRRAAMGTMAVLAALLAAGPVGAQDIAFNRWGVRAGASDDPDQVVLASRPTSARSCAMCASSRTPIWGWATT